MKSPTQAVKPGEPLPEGVEFCECGKRCYRTKGGAKKAAKRVQSQSGGGLLSTYRCRTRAGTWHIGHASHGRKAVTPERRRRR